MSRFYLEAHTPYPGHGVLVTKLGSGDVDELVEAARIRALQATEHTTMWLYDRSAVLFVVKGCGNSLVDMVDRWANDRPPLCPECGEQLHEAHMAGERAWYCHSCNFRARAA
ncbi:hypothetical protein DFR70_1262 [Nocardia tenerifensis]|uniref:Uncharacterized protein n=1 Tax=Nocardia tenerifensis TaxID=228006 RepID=A0A318K107_9NOCA|nr:hypothetical protein [Nocardia tenerifensis]PXX53881.1 hypothetical protein DFR70_1262 [Nocardia tenerifensis]